MKTRKIQNSFVLLALSSVMACSHATTPKAGLNPDHSFRASVPKAGPTPEFEVPIVEEAALENGLKIFVSNRSSLPLVNIRIVFKRGSAANPKG
ncbi:hypothetical protein KAI87_17980, partial [Myxococcota bacterium]|nr:hypothetical protein [Myxococcota bacterium]